VADAKDSRGAQNARHRGFGGHRFPCAADHIAPPSASPFLADGLAMYTDNGCFRLLPRFEGLWRRRNGTVASMDLIG